MLIIKRCALPSHQAQVHAKQVNSLHTHTHSTDELDVLEQPVTVMRAVGIVGCIQSGYCNDVAH